MYKLFIAVLLLVAVAAAKGQESFPAIPSELVETYSAQVVEERLESIVLERLLLKGKHPVRMDFIQGHRVSSKPGVSAYFDIRFRPGFSTALIVFPARGFSGGFSAENLNRYLEGKALKAPLDSAFTILEKAEVQTVGSSKFRIFGIRALNLRYSETVDGTSFTIGENWVEQDGTIFMVAVRAPSDQFDPYFKRVSRTFGSIVRAD